MTLSAGNGQPTVKPCATVILDEIKPFARSRAALVAPEAELSCSPDSRPSIQARRGADLGCPDADLRQAETLLTAKIINVLSDQSLSVRRTQDLTIFAAADFSRVRQAKLERLTLDRLIGMLMKLNADVEVRIDVHPRRHLATASVHG